MAGIQILHVPYKSNPLAINDLLGGQIDMMITDTATGLPQVQGGKVRALGVTDTKGYSMGYWFAAYVPARTPPAVVKRLNELMVAATKGPTAVKFYQTTGVDAATSTPEELAKFQQAESAKWGKIVKAANIQPE
jgi:tripartite-type tricarboxylate transporter receptor subunit TctC